MAGSTLCTHNGSCYESSFFSSLGKNTCWPRYKVWVLDDKIASYNLQIFKVIYLIGHIQVILLRLKSYTTHMLIK